jgi:Fic family protein
VGKVNTSQLYKPQTELRRKNKIKTIQSSLYIEENTLSIEQVTPILKNHSILAPAQDILEVKMRLKLIIGFKPIIVNQSLISGKPISY